MSTIMKCFDSNNLVRNLQTTNDGDLQVSVVAAAKQSMVSVTLASGGSDWASDGVTVSVNMTSHTTIMYVITTEVSSGSIGLEVSDDNSTFYPFESATISNQSGMNGQGIKGVFTNHWKYLRWRNTTSGSITQSALKYVLA